MEPPPADPLDQQGVVDVELDRGVQRLAADGQHLLKLLGLDGSPAGGGGELKFMGKMIIINKRIES